MSKDILVNKILKNKLKVFAFHPLDRNIFLSNVKDMPCNWLLYPNPLCPQGEIQEADLQDPELKNFLFHKIIPNCDYIVGQSLTMAD